MQNNDQNIQALVSFFYAFDLAEFFTKGDHSINFLNSRTDRRLHELFCYKNGGIDNEPSDKQLEKLKLFEYCKDEWEKEGRAYLTGLVRLNLLHQFFHPIYKFKTSDDKNILEELLTTNDSDSMLMDVKRIYQNHWYENKKSTFSELLSSLKIYLSISRYGIISIKIKGL